VGDGLSLSINNLDVSIALSGTSEFPNRSKGVLLLILQHKSAEGHRSGSKLVASTETVDFKSNISPVVEVASDLRIQSGVGSRLDDGGIDHP